MIDHYKKIQNLRDELYVLNPEFESKLNVDSITDVLIIWASSRSGSSVLFDTLSNHSEINSPQGEDSTFYRLYNLHQINGPESSDANILCDFDYQKVARNILRDSGIIDLYPNISKTNFFNIQRNLLQSPERNWKINELQTLINANSIYKLTSSEINQTIIEEPPFIIPKYKTQTVNKRNILLLKSSSNLHRPDYVFNLFPNAKFHHIYLRRKPEQSINGLIDGWNSTGFHSHFLKNELQIKDNEYLSKQYWKFDLPVGWSKYLDKSIPEICAFQWRSANLKLLELISKYPGTIIDYEDFFNLDLLFKKLNMMLSELNISTLPLKELNTVMPTHLPQIDRWLSKKDIIKPLIEINNLSEVYEEFKSK